MPDSMPSRENSNAYFSDESWGARPRALESVAAELDERAGSEVDLSLTWRELVEGRARVVGTFFTASRCGVVLATTDPPPAPPIVGRRLEIIELLMTGSSQNLIAIEMALAPSTVALNARLALESFGVHDRPSRVHPLLMLAATVARNRSLAAGSLSLIRFAERDLRVVGIVRPDLRLAGVLPTAELAVVGCLLEGCCYAEIARRRRTAERTIANQISAVFKRLRVSGRSELLQRLFEQQGAAPSAFPANVTPLPPPRTLPPAAHCPRPAARGASPSGPSSSANP